MNTVSKSIQYFRKLKKVSQAVLADKIGISQRYYQELESGRSEIKVSTLQNISSGLEVRPCFVLNDPLENPLTRVGIYCDSELLDLLPVAVRVVDLEGIVCYANLKHNEIYGVNGKEIGKDLCIWDYLYDKDEVPKLKEYFKLIIAEKAEAVPYYSKSKMKDGTLIPIKVDWKYNRNRNKKVMGFISIVSFHPAW